MIWPSVPSTGGTDQLEDGRVQSRTVRERVVFEEKAKPPEPSVVFSTMQPVITYSTGSTTSATTAFTYTTYKKATHLIDAFFEQAYEPHYGYSWNSAKPQPAKIHSGLGTLNPGANNGRGHGISTLKRAKPLIPY